MNAGVGSMGAVVAVVLLAGPVHAQIVVQPHTNYLAAADGKPASAEPGSTVSLPPGGDLYRVCCDYGPVVDGTFKPDAAVNKGGTSRIIINKMGAGWAYSPILDVYHAVFPVTFCDQSGNASWCVSGPQTLTNPPAGLYVRARLQVLNGFRWVDVPMAVGHAPIPIKDK